ncbi:hypothetical protein [Pararhodonellum marinum]|uniref:hypothetical protein n=1 Tax=Pararhodonellum marinum TaxID=2755358 RepID=UPI00188DE278|nr:hypothetical protein [Pararhodonellum marinum]
MKRIINMVLIVVALGFLSSCVGTRGGMNAGYYGGGYGGGFYDPMYMYGHPGYFGANYMYYNTVPRTVIVAPNNQRRVVSPQRQRNNQRNVIRNNQNRTNRTVAPSNNRNVQRRAAPSNRSQMRTPTRTSRPTAPSRSSGRSGRGGN